MTLADARRYDNTPGWLIVLMAAGLFCLAPLGIHGWPKSRQ